MNFRYRYDVSFDSILDELANDWLDHHAPDILRELLLATMYVISVLI